MKSPVRFDRLKQPVRCRHAAEGPCAAAKICILNYDCHCCAFAQWLEAALESDRKAFPGPLDARDRLPAAA